jgi:hypothetical protein
MAASAIQSLNPVCEIRADLLDRLASAVEKLGRAKLNLMEYVEERSFSSGPFVSGQVEQLRTDCGLIRAELEHHRASHGC